MGLYVLVFIIGLLFIPVILITLSIIRTYKFLRLKRKTLIKLKENECKDQHKWNSDVPELTYCEKCYKIAGKDEFIDPEFIKKFKILADKINKIVNEK